MGFHLHLYTLRRISNCFVPDCAREVEDTAKLEALFMRYTLLLTFIFSVVSFSATAEEQTICNGIINNPAIEAHFSLSKTKTYHTNIGDKEITYKVPGSSRGGSCYSEGIGYSESQQEDKDLELECNGNGCGMGDTFSLIIWQGIIYGINEEEDNFNSLEKLIGWEKLSAKEQAILKFKNLTQELYKISFDSKMANSVCEQTPSSSPSVEEKYQEKSLSNDPLCSEFNLDKVQSIFPKDADPRYPTNLLVPTGEIEYGNYEQPYDLSKIMDIDLNDDGNMERVVPYERFMGGCGCDGRYIALLDQNNKIIESAKGYRQQFIKFMQDANCRENVDIVIHNNQLYVQIFTKKRGRLLTRQIFPLTGEKAFTPICSYINTAPIVWYYRKPPSPAK